MKYHYWVVEGPHDAAAVGKVLELIGARKVKKFPTLKSLDEVEYLTNLARLNFPYKDDLTERMPVPLFFRIGSDDPQLVAVHSVGGESALVSTMAATLNNLDDNGEGFSSIAILGDADDRTPLQALNFYKEKLKEIEKLPPIMTNFEHFPTPGLVLERRQRIGVFVLPDNIHTGTLETVLLECAAASFDDVRIKAEEFVNHFTPTLGTDWSLSQKAKAVVGSINNLFRPGTSNTVSIARDQWFCTSTMTIESVSKIVLFLKQLVGFEPCPHESEVR